MKNHFIQYHKRIVDYRRINEINKIMKHLQKNKNKMKAFTNLTSILIIV